VEIKILTESEIGIYLTPDKKTMQRVITYQTTGFAPRTIWLDSDKLPDAAYLLAHPGTPVPKALQDQGDKLRRAAIEADIARIKNSPGPRTI